jgi:acyl-coenzyme A synthetase/AMP-(fatty) acid ligase
VRAWSSFDRGLDFQIDEGVATDGREWRIATLQPFSFAAGHRGLKGMALGRSMYIADPAALTVDALLDWLHAHRIDETSISPTLAATILAVAGGSRRLPHVTMLRLGTEASSWELVAPLRALASPRLTIGCGYGTTEAGGRVFSFMIRPEDPIGAGRIPLGRVVDPTRIRLEPVDGPGSRTQLLVRPLSDVRYLDDPELTARRFVTDESGTRWWVSGDLVDVDDDGIHHHRGRVDDMVKISGVLVEPREAEEALRSIPGVRDAAVLGHRTPAGKTRLVAHVAVDPGLTPEAVRSRLDEVLPRHLVPNLLVRHDELPRNDRNKLDRVGLAAAPLVRWRSRAPRVPTVETEVWLVGRVGRHHLQGDRRPDRDKWQHGRG